MIDVLCVQAVSGGELEKHQAITAETCTDATESTVLYALIDVLTMHVVMNSRDPW